ncbi:hypothetical protein SLEP1_g5630 [Rubroshorea leprosula]|uniref:PGG domain-containing protein n=1 Tax=Rubroshorea leprosula TaxID=152421 RepID=A0AAV5HYF4_9ROSI|nr:hypothetical protein SLEP1_g5630 [Rubroshorea leprosula]
MNPDVVQENSDNQTNHLALEIEEDSNRQLGNASGNQPSSETQDVNPTEAKEDAGNQLNSKLYYRATKGDFHAFEEFDKGRLKQLVTRVDKNTILHICITAATPYYRKKASRIKSVDFVNKALAKCKELLWQPNKKGETILHIAARHGHHDIVQVLLTEDRGARPQRLLEMKNEVGDTALHEAVRYTHLPVVKILINEDLKCQYGQNNDDETPLYIAAEMGDHKVVEEILKCESPACDGPHGRTALHAAVLCKNDEIVKKLCSELKEPLTGRADDSGWTPLHYASEQGFASIVKLLLEKDKNAAYMADKEEEKTALHVAASKGKAKVIEEFRSTCPDCFEQVDKKGQNVLHFAVKADRNRSEILRIILDNECFSNLINAKDNSGDTPLHHLVNANNPLALDLVYHPKLNARVFNKKHMSPLEVISDTTPEDPLRKIFALFALRFVGGTTSRQIRHEDKVKEGGGIADQKGKKEGGGIEDQDAMVKDESDQKKKDVHEKARNGMEPVFRYLKDINLVIAILISTVTFAAGFTLPGGYTSDNSPNQAGYPVLIRKLAFKVFVFSNTIAFLLASSAVFLHLTRLLYTKATILASQMSFMCNSYAMVAMVLAFVSGTSAVLMPYPSLVAAICVLSAVLFAFTSIYEGLRMFYFIVRIMKKAYERRKLLSENVGSKYGIGLV